SRKDAEVIEMKITLDKKTETFLGISITNEFKNADGQRTLWVEYIEMIPPADVRPVPQRVLFPVEAGKAKPIQTREFLTRLATKAYRRPATPSEVARLEKIVESAEKSGKKWENAVQIAAQAILVSPKFLFRLELDDRPDSTEPHAIDEFQLASRL